MDPGLDRDILGVITNEMEPGFAGFTWCNQK